MYIIYSFLYDSVLPEIDNFQPFKLVETSLRVVAALLFQKVMFRDVQGFIKLMTYLKRMRQSRQNVRGRFINILLCAMKGVLPTIGQYALVLALS